MRYLSQDGGPFGLHFFQQVKTVIAPWINGSFKSLTYILSSVV